MIVLRSHSLIESSGGVFGLLCVIDGFGCICIDDCVFHRFSQQANAQPK